MVPSAMTMPREGSFALAVFGSLSTVHEPMVNGVAVKQIVGIGNCILAYCHSPLINIKKVIICSYELLRAAKVHLG